MTNPAHICVVDQDVESPFPVYQLFQRICPNHALATFQELPSLVMLSYDQPGSESYHILQQLKQQLATWL